jgi:hypothetical protein
VLGNLQQFAASFAGEEGERLNIGLLTDAGLGMDSIDAGMKV